MSQENLLLEAFKETEYQISGHGKRAISVLKEAMDTIDGHLESDVYGNGKVIEDFQEKIAKFLGKESSVFFPSGTMAQQIALRIWCDQKSLKKVAYHPLSHLEIHEEDGLKKLHGIELILLADKEKVITFKDVVNMKEEISCLLLELPQREIGGQLPEYEELAAISNYCRDKGIKLHLDGARLFEILPFYQKSAAEVCSLFDSIYVSFYKGIGGIAGAILAGPKDFTDESKVWKRRHGGDLISLYPYIISADYYFDQRVNKMGQYYEEAKELAALYNQCSNVETIPELPVSNMFHVHFTAPKEKVEHILTNLCRETGIGLTGYVKEVSGNQCFYEVSIGDRYGRIPKGKLEVLFKLINERLTEKSLI